MLKNRNRQRLKTSAMCKLSDARIANLLKNRFSVESKMHINVHYQHLKDFMTIMTETGSAPTARRGEEE